jgi:hypothetical protein
VKVRWQDAKADAYWGASVHRNTHLEAYVVLMSRTCCRPKWPQAGIYVTSSRRLDNSRGWSSPARTLGKVKYDAGYYPQVIGTGPGESDTLAGRVARLWVHGMSFWEIVFEKRSEAEP